MEEGLVLDLGDLVVIALSPQGELERKGRGCPRLDGPADDPG